MTTISGCCWVPVGPGSSIPWCFHPGSGPSPPPPPPSPPPPPPPPGAPPFNNTEMGTLWKYFMANVNVDGSGQVVASPDRNTPGGSYYFHWARDGALTMHTVLMHYTGVDRDDLMKVCFKKI